MDNYVRKQINSAYRKVTGIAYFDKVKGNEPINPNDKLDIIPDKFHDFVDETKKGCCLLFATYMLRELKGKGIDCCIVLTPEGDGIRGSLLYYDDGDLFVANPVEDIEFFTDNDVKEEERRNFYAQDTSTMIINGVPHDDSRIPLQEFANRYGEVRVFTTFYDENLTTFGQALSRAYEEEAMIIAAPDKNMPLGKK